MKDDISSLTATIKADANIVGWPSREIDATSLSTLKWLEEEAAKIIQGNAEASVKQAKALKSDIFGFGLRLSKQHPAYFRKIKDQWNDHYFPELQVNYAVKVSIRKTGTTGNTTLK
ncbi:Spore germination protein A3 precursor [compost metagenome]